MWRQTDIIDVKNDAAVGQFAVLYCYLLIHIQRAPVPMKKFIHIQNIPLKRTSRIFIKKFYFCIIIVVHEIPLNYTVRQRQIELFRFTFNPYVQRPLVNVPCQTKIRPQLLRVTRMI